MANDNNAAQGGAEAGGHDDRTGTTEQLSAIMARGLDLLEATVNLGVNLMARLSSMAQVSTSAPPDGTGQPTPAQWPQTPPSYAAAEPGGAPAPPPAPPDAADINIVNRLPLFPGSAVSVSFTINNDSAAAARRPDLAAEPFAGRLSRFVLGPETLGVRPASQVIAPMDFEKFTLAGAIPATAPADVYDGWIVVSDEGQLRIPARLVVGLPQGGPG